MQIKYFLSLFILLLGGCVTSADSGAGQSQFGREPGEEDLINWTEENQFRKIRPVVTGNAVTKLAYTQQTPGQLNYIADTGEELLIYSAFIPALFDRCREEHTSPYFVWDPTRWNNIRYVFFQNSGPKRSDRVVDIARRYANGDRNSDYRKAIDGCLMQMLNGYKQTIRHETRNATKANDMINVTLRLASDKRMFKMLGIPHRDGQPALNEDEVRADRWNNVVESHFPSEDPNRVQDAYDRHVDAFGSAFDDLTDITSLPRHVSIGLLATTFKWVAVQTAALDVISGALSPLEALEARQKLTEIGHTFDTPKQWADYFNSVALADTEHAIEIEAQSAQHADSYGSDRNEDRGQSVGGGGLDGECGRCY